MMVNYKPVKIIINVPRLTKVIINVVIFYHNLSDPIVTNKGMVFTLKFLLLLC